MTITVHYNNGRYGHRGWILQGLESPSDIGWQVWYRMCIVIDNIDVGIIPWDVYEQIEGLQGKVP